MGQDRHKKDKFGGHIWSTCPGKLNKSGDDLHSQFSNWDELRSLLLGQPIWGLFKQVGGNHLALEMTTERVWAPLAKDLILNEKSLTKQNNCAGNHVQRNGEESGVHIWNHTLLFYSSAEFPQTVNVWDIIIAHNHLGHIDSASQKQKMECWIKNSRFMPFPHLPPD